MHVDDRPRNADAMAKAHAAGQGRGLNPSALAALNTLSSYCQEGNVAFPGQDRWAEESGIRRQHLGTEVIPRLEEAGLIEWTGRHHPEYRTKIFRLLFLDAGGVELDDILEGTCPKSGHTNGVHVRISDTNTESVCKREKKEEKKVHTQSKRVDVRNPDMSSSERPASRFDAFRQIKDVRDQPSEERPAPEKQRPSRRLDILRKTVQAEGTTGSGEASAAAL